MPDTIENQVASAVAWLDYDQVQELLRLLVAGHHEQAQAALERSAPDLTDTCDLRRSDWREAFMDELEFRIAGPDDDDPDLVATREVPDYTRFADDRRGS